MNEFDSICAVRQPNSLAAIDRIVISLSLPISAGGFALFRVDTSGPLLMGG